MAIALLIVQSNSISTIMQRYTDKVYKDNSSKINVPLVQSIKQPSSCQNSFSLISSQILKSIQNSRIMPLTQTKQKCKNCTRLQFTMNELISQLLVIEKNISQKQQKLGQMIAQKEQTILQLQTKLTTVNDKNQFNHLTSTFFTQTGNRVMGKNPNLTVIEKQTKKGIISEVKQIKDKYTYISQDILDISVQQNRQKQNQNKTNQNISVNCQSVKDKTINKLQFENKILKDYNDCLLKQLEKAKKGRTIK